MLKQNLNTQAYIERQQHTFYFFHPLTDKKATVVKAEGCFQTSKGKKLHNETEAHN